MSDTTRHTITQRTLLSPGPRKPGERRACVVVIYGEGLGQRACIDAEPIMIGRSAEADLQLAHASVSRRHCRIWFEDGRHYIRDLGSTNRTRINDTAIAGEASALVDGDHITVGESILKFVSHASVEAPYHAELYQLATHDALTGLCNRRHFLELLDKELVRALRHKRALSLCVLDIDFFKRINDNHGHAEGDEVLRRVGATIRNYARVEDVSARIGGEEFAILFPETDGPATQLICERLRTAVAQTAFQFDGQPECITISIGIASLRRSDTAAELVRRADEAMYRAKHAGRNQICGCTADEATQV